MKTARSNLVLPKVGERIRVEEPYYFDQMQVVPQKATGTIVKVEVEKDQVQPTIHVKMDGDGYGLEDGIMSFYPQCGPQYAGREAPDQTILSWFHFHCRIIP